LNGLPIDRDILEESNQAPIQEEEDENYLDE